MDGIPTLHVDAIELFGGYHLTTIQISLLNSIAPSIASGLVPLQQLSPNIHRLILDSSRDDISFQFPPVLHPGSPLTLSLTHIELRGTPCNVSIWPYLPLFPSLVSVYGHIPPKTGHRIPEIEPDSTTSFPELKVLELEWSKESQPFTEFMCIVFKQTLHKLECFRLRYLQPCLQDISVLHDIAKLCNPTTLQILELNVQWHGDPELRNPEGQRPDIQSYDLASLQSFRQLRKLIVRPMIFMDLENNALESLASSLPFLEELRIGCSDLWVFPPKVTLEGLIPFSRHCPRLLCLAIVLDARKRVPDHVIRREVLPMHSICKLKTLDVSCSPINDTPAEAKYVSSLLKILFPHLTQIRRFKDESCFFLLGGERREMAGWAHAQNFLDSPESEDWLMDHD
ncbi:hypothetical protein NLI96_g11466 [Meripilus lineatus]|uniref:Uncharacterized protein n=1 Tax=Meripilus lineatus TaxID=2056292 RepID=A0AAD5UU57_9APHY|nr:hypothetical protein NLI96_g11466 [Physisporinus lineatus]